MHCSLRQNEYHKKVSILLQDPKTYRTVKKNPSSRIEKRLNSFVRNLFECKKLSFSMYKFLRSTNSVLPRMYGLPEILKPNLPLRPIVFFVGSATYELSKFLKNILSPLVGITVNTVKNFAEFVELIEKINIRDNESQVSFDVVSLFTSIPLETARAIVLDRLSNDCTLEYRTNLTITELTEALDICLTSTYFTYNNKYYEQIFGIPMDSSLSPVIANMMMEDLEQQALSTFHNPPSIWVRYVDNIYAVVKTENVNAFHKHLNTFNFSIQFTVEMETSGSIAFLDVQLTRELDGSISTSIFRKSTLFLDLKKAFDSVRP